MKMMTWDEVREQFPGQFVKFEVIKSHIDGNKEYVDEVAIIKVIPDGKQAMKEFVRSGKGQYVYSTNNESVVINLVKHAGIRRSM
jgi:hypothetical protein